MYVLFYFYYTSTSFFSIFSSFPAINCPIPGSEYITDVDAILVAAQLTIHALFHQQGANVAVSIKQKPPKIERPVVLRGFMEEEWYTFLGGIFLSKVEVFLEDKFPNKSGNVGIRTLKKIYLRMLPMHQILLSMPCSQPLSDLQSFQPQPVFESLNC